MHWYRFIFMHTYCTLDADWDWGYVHHRQRQWPHRKQLAYLQCRQDEPGFGAQNFSRLKLERYCVVAYPWVFALCRLGNRRWDLWLGLWWGLLRTRRLRWRIRRWIGEIVISILFENLSSPCWCSTPRRHLSLLENRWLTFRTRLAAIVAGSCRETQTFSCFRIVCCLGFSADARDSKSQSRRG